MGVELCINWSIMMINSTCVPRSFAQDCGIFQTDHEVWEENNKERIETIFKTPVSSISSGKYYRFNDFAS